MDQKKTGQFLRELRKEKEVTQEQLAEILGVSNRSISRWETGANMPDFDLMIELAKYYDVGIEELIDGERKNNNMRKETEETLLKVADYNNNDKMIVTRRMGYFFGAALVAFFIYMILDIKGLADQPGVYEDIASFMLGLVCGALVLGTLYTSRCMSRIHALKMRLLGRKK